MSDPSEFLSKYKGKGVFVDTNLLVLYLVGLVNRNRIARFKRTQSFTTEDFELLAELIAWFGSPLIATPHVLSETSNLTDLHGNEFTQIRNLFRELVMKQVDERVDLAKTLVADPAFQRLGIADASIAAIAAQGILVLTADFALYYHLQAAGLPCLNFNHLRTMNW